MNPLFIPQAPALEQNAALPPLFHGALHAHWAAAAKAKGFDLIARVKDHLHLALRCHMCSGINVTRHFVVMNNQPLCHHCIERRWRQTALSAGLGWLGRDQSNRHYGHYRLPCGHESRRQFAFVDRVARGLVAARCETCLIAREAAEARRFNWTRLGPDPDGNPNYRHYQHSCGHQQRIAVTNMRWGQCDCAACGQSWTSKPSFLYLLDIRFEDQHFLKLGYSAHPAKRHRHQLGLPKSAQVEVLRVVAMPTGHDACAIEKRAHADLRRTHASEIVPAEEFSTLMNVVSEIYRPQLLPVLQQVLDRIESRVTATAGQSPARKSPRKRSRISR